MKKDELIKFQIKRDTNLRKEVSNRVIMPIIKAINKRGLFFKDFLAGTPYDESYFINKRDRVEWWVYCKVLSNMRPYFSLKDFEDIGADFFESGNYIEGLMGFLLFTSPKFSKLFADKILRRITSPILCKDMQIEYFGTNKIRITLLVEEGFEHPPEFVHGNKGIIHELGNKAGLKDCKVDFTYVPNGAYYDMSWRKEGVLFKLRRIIRWMFNINKAFWELTDSNEELIKDYEKLEDYKNNLEIKVEERTKELKQTQDKLSNTIDLLQKTQLAQNRFFTNISHEFRTPLTLISGPVKQIIERTNDDKTRDELKVVHKNANKLLNLVNQLLDISRVESGNMKLQASPQNIIPFVKALLQSFSSYAERKRITLNFCSSGDEIIAYIDGDKIEKIITNVLSNAFKFTPEGGRIEVSVITDEKYFNINISDTGVGIPEAMKSKIFDRFYQVDGSHTREQEGTGIGLSLTKELVELHKGKIEVESKEGVGTTFTISIPLGKEYLKSDEIIPEITDQEKESEKDVIEHSSEEFIDEGEGQKSESSRIEKLELPILLIVEDNPDVRNYIKNNMENDYRILEAVDGADGWNRSIDQLPDLIISDVMMPKMDGLTLCDKLKTDERTSHIPVILLTAKAALQDKIDGFDTGADDYIMKPFDPEELKARVKNLIEQRKRIHEHFKKHGLFEIVEKKITSLDQRILKNIFETISQHISDSSLSVEFLAENLSLSRSVLHRKVVSLLGETPGDLIRRIRLAKAADLIKQGFGNLSQIALEIGFSNPAHFSESFKKQYGVSPSQYQQKNTNK